ncbi:MAG: gephyrin-like molybdotransferase Glp [Pseudomonadota bacterium]
MPDSPDLSVAQAQQMIATLVKPIQDSETVSIHGALNRVLAADIISPINVPAHDNSAMDGFAFRAAELVKRSDSGHIRLKIVGSAYAGRPFQGSVAAGECVRINTGSVMPADCDTVIPLEATIDGSASSVNTEVSFTSDSIKSGANCRRAGEDLRAGSAALKRGKIIRPADLGLLASLGVAALPVQRRLRVAFFSTGDELRSIGEALDPGCVYDSNRYTLFGMLKRLDCDLLDLGVIKDKPAALETAFRHAAEHADVIITSGGVSHGGADYTRDVMAQLGQVAFWKINMRPGRPMAFGPIHSNGKSALLFGLPGNPVAVMITFYFMVRAALLHMMGADARPLPLLRVKSHDDIRKKLGRSEYQRGILSHDADGRQQVRITGAQGSGILRSMSEANCMVVLHEQQGNIAAGDEVDVVLFDGLI